MLIGCNYLDRSRPAVALLGAFLVIGGFVAVATVGLVSYGWFA
jgi:hypothetical protein